METVEILHYHSILIKALLGFVVLGIVGAMFGAKDKEGFKKFSFVYTLIFQLILTIIAILGAVLVYQNSSLFGLSSVIMIVAFALMLFLEIKRHKRVKLLSDELKAYRSNFTKTAIIEIVIIALMVVLMILKAKGVISI